MIAAGDVAERRHRDAVVGRYRDHRARRVFAEQPAGALAFGGRAEDHAVGDRAQMLERNGGGVAVPGLLRSLLRGPVDRELPRGKHVEPRRPLVG